MRLQDLLSETKRFLPYTGGCSTCPMKLVDYVPPTLAPTKIILVGEAPGRTEVEEQEGFTGDSGQTIRAAFRDVGITEFSLSNSIHCRPPGNADPPEKAVSCCMNQHVIHEVAPYPLVVLAGNVAANAFFPGHAQHVRGNLAYHPDFPNSRFFSILHPASIGYDPRRKEEFYQQIDRLGRINRGDLDAPFRMVTGPQFVVQWAAFLAAANFLSLDLETNQLESWLPGGKIVSLAACAPHVDDVFSIEASDPYWTTALHLLKEWLLNPEHQVLGKNIGFDLVWLEATLEFKCNLKHIHDLQVLYYQLEGDRHAGLKQMVARKLDGYRHLVVWPHLEKNPHRLKLYNSEDVHYPKKLFLQDFLRLRSRTQDLIRRVSGPSSLSCARITHAGMYFRSEAWKPLDEEFATAREKAIADWERGSPLFDRKKYVTPKGFKNLEHYVYTVQGYPVINVTEVEKKPSTDDGTIKELVRQGAKELEHCLTIKNIDKRISTYIRAYPKLVAPDRRIHANYHNTRTSTGRLSSSDPNMQNNPRNESHWKNQIRWLFGSAPGNKLIFGDYSQIELRIAMVLANDPVGKTIYLEGKDIHIETAKFLLQDEPSDPNDWKAKGTKWCNARTDAKSANFALIYGGTAYTIQVYAMNEFGIIMSDEAAARWHRGFFGRYSALEPWHEDEKKKLRVNKGYVESAVGHVWYHRNWDSQTSWVREHEERAAINSTCQGPASYMMTYLIYLVQQEMWKRNIRAHNLGFAEVVHTVHDSLASEVAEDQVDEGRAIVKEQLAHVVEWTKDWFTVPLVLDIDVGEIWDG